MAPSSTGDPAILSPLPAAPELVVDAEGRPRFGVYQGSLARADWQGLREPRVPGGFYTLTHHKRWIYTAVNTHRYLCAVAVVELSYASNAFVFVADLAARRNLVQRSFLGVPGLSARVGPHPAVGALARFRAPGARIELARPDAASPYRLTVDLGRQLRLDAALDPAGATPLTFLGPVGGGGRANATQKVAGLPAQVSLTVEGRPLDLDGAVGGMDFTDGLLARETSWRWAFAQGKAEDGTPVAFNLVEGFNQAVDGGACEDAVWVEGQPFSVGGGRFEFDGSDPLRPWTVGSRCGAVELTFTPAADHRERHNLLLASSRFLQVAGTFRGTLRAAGRTLTVSGLGGVTEDQSVRW